jgi:hypothetical protein
VGRGVCTRRDGSIAPDAVPALIKALGDPSVLVASHAAGELGGRSGSWPTGSGFQGAQLPRKSPWSLINVGSSQG